MKSKVTLQAVAVFVVTAIAALSDNITPEVGWADVFSPRMFLPALSAGIVAVLAFFNQSVRSFRNGDPPKT